VRTFLDRAVHSTRNLTFELSLPILYEMGLQEAVEWLAEEFQKQHGLQVAVQRSPHPVSLAEGARVLLFRLVRELLTNVVKHARASRARIVFRRTKNLLYIQIEDDGVGFDAAPNAAFAHGTVGFGLFSVRERLSHLGGRLTVDSAPGRGTRITISLPFKADGDGSSVS